MKITGTAVVDMLLTRFENREMRDKLAADKVRLVIIADEVLRRLEVFDKDYPAAAAALILIEAADLLGTMLAEGIARGRQP